MIEGSQMLSQHPPDCVVLYDPQFEPVRLAPFRYKSYIADAVATEFRALCATSQIGRMNRPFYRAASNPFRYRAQHMPTVLVYGCV